MQVVKVRLRKPRRVLSFLCGDALTLNRDEPCIVQSDHGPEWGLCILPPEPCPQDMETHYPMRLLRKANANDFKTFDVMAHQECKARGVCLEKIRQRNMPMKLVDVEYTFDQRKVIFYFTADERVDFRELVRDLAHELRTRIELRHIQVRDEARLVGGLGSCGRQLCCATWLNEFKPISMRMAKRQNLSLNPTKISGQCGRLLCCLNYEFEQYPHGKKKSQQPRTEPEPEDDEADIEEDALDDEDDDFPEEADEQLQQDSDPARSGDPGRDSGERRSPRRRRRRRPRSNQGPGRQNT
ncbi:MAG TPA: regulatory iron-sulfur-containing complex subunit RicT [Candidatus Hydrogenedentes bacterium]|nr:regulatory iron-sulfur-containing complex subunit RicT [Candidatus Hydrogenedentota bacterium]